MMSNNCDKSVGFKNLVIIFFVLYFTALAFRIYDIQNDDYQPDEFHWIDRSRGIIERFNKGQYSSLTSHLDHPGVPPAILMAVGEIAAKSYNSFRGVAPKNPGFVDGLTGARMMIALVSSLVVPLIFYFLLQFFGLRTALLTSALFAFDPIHIGLSREAHLDSILTLFVVTAAFLFVAAERNKKTSTKLFAGVFWGLAMATKVSAIGFLVALVFYRFLTTVVWIVSKKRINVSLRDKPVLIMWSDVGAILLGHLTLGIVYTRLWTQQQGFSVLKGVHSAFADSSYQFATWLRYSETVSAKIILLAAIASFMTGVYFAIKAKRINNNSFIFHGAIILSAVSVVVLIHFLVPSLIDNFIRLYLRVFGLKDIPHNAYGHPKPPIPFGYLFIIFNRLTFVALVGLVPAVLLLLKKQWRALLLPDSEAAKILLILLVVAAVWIGVLGASPKKTIRYIMPVVPVIYLVAALAWQAVFSIIGSFYDRQFGRSKQRNDRLMIFGCCGVVAVQFGIALSSAPEFFTYYSPFLGGFKGAAEKNLAQPILGQEEIVRFLDSRPRGDFVERKVKVIGDYEMLQATAARLYRPDVMPIHFMPQHGEIEGYYLVVYWSFFKDIDPGYLNKIISTPFAEGMRVFDYNYRGVNIASIFSFSMASLEKPVYFKFEDMMQGTGKREFYRDTKPVWPEDGARMVTALPGRDKKGFVAFNHDVVLRSGEFKLGVLIGIPADVKLNPEITPDRYAIRLELTKDCQKVITLGELSQKRLNWVEFNCRAEQSRNYRFRAYWFGNVPVVLSKIRLRR